MNEMKKEGVEGNEIEEREKEGEKIIENEVQGLIDMMSDVERLEIERLKKKVME